jgi:hypothetical protein
VGNSRVLKASIGSSTPSYSLLTLSDLNDVGEQVPTSGQLLRWNGSAWAPATVETGGGGVTGDSRQTIYNDENFGATGTLAGSRTLGTASVTITSGDWLIESQVHLSAKGGAGTFTTTLTGNGAPGGADVSSRIFETDGGIRQVLLTGRRYVTVSTSTTINVTASVVHNSGFQSDIRDGAVFVVATPR